MDGDEGGPIAARLARPETLVRMEDLAGRWFHQVVILETARPRRMDAILDVLGRLRGALGNVLLPLASREAREGRACRYDPPSALDIFFREQLRLSGRHGIPKPFVLAMDAGPRSLVIRLTVFGFACDWTLTMRDALLAAVERVEWVRNASPRTAETLEIRNCRIISAPGIDVPPAPEVVDMVFETPVDASASDLLLFPATVVARLARRIDGLARWMDLSLDVFWDEAALVWETLDYGWSDVETGTSFRGSSRQQRGYGYPVIWGRLRIGGPLTPLWPLLMIGQTSHAGRGATAGLGRYRLEEAEDFGAL